MGTMGKRPPPAKKASKKVAASLPTKTIGKPSPGLTDKAAAVKKGGLLSSPPTALVAPSPSALKTLTSPEKGQGPTSATRLNPAQVERAVTALLKHHAKMTAERVAQSKKLDLLGDNADYLSVQLGLESIPERPSPKPIPIPLPHPFYTPEEGFEMCLIVKEDCKAVVKKALEALKVPGLSTVVGLQELRVDYRKFEERRKLRDAFDMFLVDDRILPNLCRALGKVFFSKKKQPVPIKIGGLAGKGDPATVAKRVLTARSQTYMYMSHGTCLSLRVGRTSQAPQDLRDNIILAVENAVDKIPKKWKNVVSVCVKTSESVALPVYNKLPPSALAALKKTEGEEEKKEEEEAAAAGGAPAASPGKKRKESPVVKTESLLVKSHLEDKAKKARLEEEKKVAALVKGPPPPPVTTKTSGSSSSSSSKGEQVKVATTKKASKSGKASMGGGGDGKQAEKAALVAGKGGKGKKEKLLGAEGKKKKKLKKA